MRQTAAIMLLVALGPACQSVPFPAYTVQDDAAFRATMVEAVVGSRCVMRVVLAVSGSEAVFTLYACVLAPDAIRMAAVADIGSTVFDVSLTGGVATVIQGSAVLGDDFLADHLVRDFAAAIVEPTRAQSVVVQAADGGRAILTRRGGDDLLRRAGPRPGEVLISRGARDRLEATIAIERNAAARDGIPGHPAAFSIVAADSAWSARVEVVQWFVGDAAAVSPGP